MYSNNMIPIDRDLIESGEFECELDNYCFVYTLTTRKLGVYAFDGDNYKCREGTIDLPEETSGQFRIDYPFILINDLEGDGCRIFELITMQQLHWFRKHYRVMALDKGIIYAEEWTSENARLPCATVIDVLNNDPHEFALCKRGNYFIDTNSPFPHGPICLYEGPCRSDLVQMFILCHRFNYTLPGESKICNILEHSQNLFGKDLRS